MFQSCIGAVPDFLSQEIAVRISTSVNQNKFLLPSSLSKGKIYSIYKPSKSDAFPSSLFPILKCENANASQWGRQGFSRRQVQCSAKENNSEGSDEVPEDGKESKMKEGKNPDSLGVTGSGDWRTFRAYLVGLEREHERKLKAIREGYVLSSEGGQDMENMEIEGAQNYPADKIGERWAHPLAELEKGCILVASELLDGYAFFERSVILLLSTGNDGAPYGLVLNKPHPQKVGKITGMGTKLARAFGPCQAYIGGPLDDQRFLLMHGKRELHGFDEVFPGAYFGGAAGVEAAVSLLHRKLAKPEDFCFYFGYAGWDKDQLQNEINLGWWHIAACSRGIALEKSDNNLWQEVLTLMGEEYAEIIQRDTPGSGFADH